jgi:hypothetical protein
MRALASARLLFQRFAVRRMDEELVYRTGMAVTSTF